MARFFSLLHSTTLLAVFHISYVHGQTISTNTPVPPLQWINLTGLLKGSFPPPPLKDAVIGYDEISRSVIIFGGESPSGFVQSKTYLLNLDTLTWSAPSPPTSLQRTPAARSASVAGCDFAASNRHGFIIIGGKGSDESGLSDVWEYDFNNQFWSPVDITAGGPPGRWGASGGIDISTAPIQDPVVPGPNNTFYLVGGYDGVRSNPLSDVWRLNISGTMSSNLPSSNGSWDHLTIGNLPFKVGQAGTVISQQIVVAGGCNTTSMTNNSCAQQDSYVIDVQRQSQISPSACPAPRSGPVLVQNFNRFSSTFASQVFLLLGTFNTTLWQDNHGLEKGEVAVLDINTGSWSRILPAGDPGVSGQPSFPSPREGAAAFSYLSGLVGRSRTAYSDTIVFGGRDHLGNYLSEVWLLRAYSGTVTASSPRWSGYGNGQLQSGTDANGVGVQVEYMSQCATAFTPSSSSQSPSASNTSSSSSSSLPVRSYDTSNLHKALAPLSLAFLQIAFLLFRGAPPSFSQNASSNFRMSYGFMPFTLALVAYGLGVVGLVISFTTVSTTASVIKRSSSSLILKTVHGKAGLAFFVCLYGLIPVLTLVSAYLKRPPDLTDENRSENNETERAGSSDITEKLGLARGPPNYAPPSVHNASLPSSPLPQTHHSGSPSMLHLSQEGRLSSDSDSIGSFTPQRGFEVMNRLPRNRRASGSWLASSVPENPSRHIASKSLGDVDWLQRRRSLNAVGELDYIITQARRAQQASANATTDALMTSTHSQSRLELPHEFDLILHVLTQVFFLGLSAIVLAALWTRGHRAPFAVFLAWTVVFYIAIFVFAWHRRPPNSILSATISRLRYKPQELSNFPLTSVTQPSEPQVPFPTQGPYVHQPPYRAAPPVGTDDISYSHGGPRSVETDDNDDDIDEGTRQRVIEEEMDRRDVSIVTIPRRKLWITNPS